MCYDLRRYKEKPKVFLCDFASPALQDKFCVRNIFYNESLKTIKLKNIKKPQIRFNSNLRLFVLNKNRNNLSLPMCR